MRFIILIAFILAFVACSQDDNETSTFLDCQENSGNFKEYDGEDIGCQLHYFLTEFDGKQYLELNSHCADFTRPYVINDDCEDICEVAPFDKNSKCGKYLDGREIIKIILIEAE